MQAYRKFLVLSVTFPSHLPWMADLVLREPIRSRGRLKGVGKERDRTGAKTLRKLMAEIGGGQSLAYVWKTTPSGQFDFGLGGIANCWPKAGCFIGGRKHHRWTPARFFSPLKRRKGWGLSAGKAQTHHRGHGGRRGFQEIGNLVQLQFFLCALCGSAVKNSSIQGEESECLYNIAFYSK